MGNWEKAEMFMNVIRELTAEAPQDIKSAILRLKMAVQKENYDKAIENGAVLFTSNDPKWAMEYLREKGLHD